MREYKWIGLQDYIIDIFTSYESTPRGGPLRFSFSAEERLVIWVPGRESTMN